MPQTTELRVFISSTFRDLQEEREHLVKKIFPEVRALCRQRGVTFTEIDLRWGLTEEEAVRGQVIRTCLEEVDKCRPYFIGMIGNRYGWVPEFHEIMMDPELLGKYPWIEEAAMEGVSVTEMEFIHGVFDAPQVDGEYAFFYHREDDTREADDPERLTSLIERARSTDHPFRDFQSSEELGSLVRGDLLAMIDKFWPEVETPSELELERRSHTAFAASRTRAYIPNPIYLKEFSRWIAEGEKPLIIHGPSGLGKSSLVAYLTEYFRKKHPDAFVVEHYVGASDGSGSAAAIMRHTLEEIKERFAPDIRIPSTQNELQASFASGLLRAEHLAAEAGIQILIVIDAVNQLEEYGRRLAWLPKDIPSGIKMVISTTPAETLDTLHERGWEELPVTPLADERVRQSIVVRYLGEFKKGVSADQLRRLTNDSKASSPLYLRVVAEELRLHGEHESLDTVIRRFNETDDMHDIFDLVLERMEQDYGADPLGNLLRLIAVSRSGLSEPELLTLSGMSRIELSRVLFALDYHLIHRDGFLGFFHDYLRRTVERRYLADQEREHSARRHVVDFFRKEIEYAIANRLPVDQRHALELCHGLEALGAEEELVEALSTIPVFIALYQGESVYNVLGYWTVLGEKYNIVDGYLEAIRTWREEALSFHEVNNVLERVGALMQSVSELDTAISIQRTRLQLASEHGEQLIEAQSRMALAGQVRLKGDYDEAYNELLRAYDLFKALGDNKGIASATINLGVIHTSRSDHDEALRYLHQSEQAARESGNRSHLMLALGNAGSVYCDLQQYESALEYCHQYVMLARELGDLKGLATAYSNLAMAYVGIKDHAKAIEGYQKAEAVSRQIGDMLLVFIAIGNRGRLHIELGEYVMALEYLEQALNGHRAMGYKKGVSTWLESMCLGLVESVEHCLERPEGIERFVPEATGPDWQLPVLNEARALAEEGLVVSKELKRTAIVTSLEQMMERIAAQEDGDATSSM